MTLADAKARRDRSRIESKRVLARIIGAAKLPFGHVFWALLSWQARLDTAAENEAAAFDSRWVRDLKGGEIPANGEEPV
jgi:hypothetical protein